jgi:hypothetical protein
MSELSKRDVANQLAALQQKARVAGASAGRTWLVETLLGDYDLLKVVADACRGAGIGGQEERVAYCLIQLCQKRDPRRAGGERYGLVLGEDEFPGRLGHWAATIAGNLRDWSDTYAAIHDEAESFQITTLRRLVQRSVRDDDEVDRMADLLVDLFARMAPLGAMNLEEARSGVPLAGNEYVFQSPLLNWVATIARRRAPRIESADPLPLSSLDAFAPADNPPGVAREELQAAFVRQIRDVAESVVPLQDAVARTQTLEQAVAKLQPLGSDDAAFLVRLRAELTYMSDELHLEQRSLDPMLAYILLGMGSAPKLQRVALLSLLGEREVAEHLTARLEAIVSAGAAPAPRLVNMAERAIADGVPARRARTLQHLRDDHAARAQTYAALRLLLTELPPTAGDIDAIQAAMSGSPARSSITRLRSTAASELAAIDPVFGRVFRRFAMRPVAGSTAWHDVTASASRDPDLPRAIADEAISRTTKADDVLRGLWHRTPSERAHAARRARRLDELTPELTAELTLCATSDPDKEVRALCASTLRAHGLPV